MITIYNTTFLQSDFSVNDSCKSTVSEKNQAAAGFAVAVWQTIIIAFHSGNLCFRLLPGSAETLDGRGGKYITV